MATKTNAKKTPLTDSNFIILMILASILILGATILVGKSLVTTIVRDTKVIEKKNTAKKQLDANLKAAPLLISAFGQLGTTKKLLSDALPSSPDFPSLIAQLENMAGTAGVVLKNVEPALITGNVSTTGATVPSGATAATPVPFPVTMNVSGSYDAYKKLLDAIEHSSRPIRVTGTQISGSGSELTVITDFTTFSMGDAVIPYKMETIK